MHAIKLLHTHLQVACPSIHSKRLTSLLCATKTVAQAQQLSITGIGRALKSNTTAKHNIKRIDRLVGNVWLRSERESIYRSLIQWLLRGQKHPLIIVDWSDLTADREHQLLRAAIPLGGRSLTLYEQVHPMARCANRQVHRRFLKTLKTLLPEGMEPILVTDAGFRATWFADVEALGWHWIGRVRNRDFVQLKESDHWISSKTLYQQATARAQKLGQAVLVRSNPLACALYLFKKPKQGRVAKTVFGQPQCNAHSNKIARREREPWLLAASLTLNTLTAKQVVSIYKKRMQIEEGFRDIKCDRYGLGLSNSLTQAPARLEILLLIGALALLVLWLMGVAAYEQQYQYRYQSNTQRSKKVLSSLFLAMLIVKTSPQLIGYADIKRTVKKIPHIVQQEHFS